MNGAETSLTFYHATPEAAATWGARIHYRPAMVGVALMVPGIAMSVQGDDRGVPLAIIGSLATLGGVVGFLITLAVVKLGRPPRQDLPT